MDKVPVAHPDSPVTEQLFTKQEDKRTILRAQEKHYSDRRNAVTFLHKTLWHDDGVWFPPFMLDQEHSLV